VVARSAAAGGVVVADVRGPAARSGLRAGDRIVWLNGGTPLDVLDLEDAAADGVLELAVLRGQRRFRLVVPLASGEWHGVSLDHGGLGDKPRVCRNDCRFCFVDQVPPGLRPALYVKDDDYRLSLLHGNFITLSNLGDADLRRIEELCLSPLYVSLHAWDDTVRVRLMGRAAAGSRAALERLAAAGIELHLQVVLCPGWNDSDMLAETVVRTAALPGVADLGVVPVSLAAEGELRRVAAGDAARTLAMIAAWQRGFRGTLGRSFVHAADELYLLAGEQPPRSDAPEQYENGVGIAAALVEEAEGLVRAASRGPLAGRNGDRAAVTALAPVSGATSLRLLTGELAVPVVARVAGMLAGAARLPVRPFAVANRLFGAHVTITGLLGGGEVLAALRQEPLAEGEWLLAPRVFLPEPLGCTLDDVGEHDLAAACGGRLAIVESLGEGFATLA